MSEFEWTPRVLVTGALGQIGSELLPALRKRFGNECVIASDLRMDTPLAGNDDCISEHIDCTNPQQILEVVRSYDVGVIYHLAALLSASAEEKPQTAWTVNMGGLRNVLEVARQYNCSVFFPSSIGALGPSTPHEQTPQDTIQRPTTMYGVTKVAGELLCDYYAHRFGVDTRGLRLPGLVSSASKPGGGTTDYAVEMFHNALRYKHYSCWLKGDTKLDMMYMPDAVRAMMELMDADPRSLKHRNAFNVSAMSVTPNDIAAAIQVHIPEFMVDFEVDPMRQAIADSWPQSVDDAAARSEWGWHPEYDLAAMTRDMLEMLGTKTGTAEKDSTK